MDSPNLSTETASDLSIASEQAKDDLEHLSSNRSTWKSRRDCIQAYFCFLMNFANGIQFAASIGRYGLLIFIPYAISVIFVGIPAVLIEVMMSRFVMKHIAEAWNMCPLVRGVLWILLGTTIINVTNNFIYIVYLIRYIFASLSDRLKWNKCNDYWNTITCYKAGKKIYALNNCFRNNSESFCLSLKWETSGFQFWKYVITDKTSVIDVSFIFCLLVAICLIITIIFKEIRSLERVLVILVIFPLILGIILGWTSFSTPEALMGFKRIFVFHWDWLLSPEIWVEGLENTLLFLGLGDLSLTLVSSHGKFTDDIFVDVVIITFGSFVFCIVFMIPIVSVCAGSQVKLAADQPYHLKIFKDKEDVFISISDALTLFPIPINLWAALTYFNWFLITLGTQAVLVLAVCDIFVGLMEFDFFITVVTFLILSFLTTFCFMFFNFEFEFDIGSVALLVIILFTITWQLFYGVQKFNYNFFFMLGHPLPFYMKSSWVSLLFLPLIKVARMQGRNIVMTLTLTLNRDVKIKSGSTLVSEMTIPIFDFRFGKSRKFYVQTALVLKIYFCIPSQPHIHICYIYVAVPFLIYFFGFICELTVLKYKREKIFSLFLANPNWGPDNALLKKSRIILASGNVNREFMYRQELNKKPLEKNYNFAEQNIVQLV